MCRVSANYLKGEDNQYQSQILRHATTLENCTYLFEKIKGKVNTVLPPTVTLRRSYPAVLVTLPCSAEWFQIYWAPNIVENSQGIK